MSIRKSKLIVIAKSVLASLTMNQKPWFGRNNSGILVVAIAVRITIRSGMLATLVKRPIKISKPHAISKVPTKCAVKSAIRKANLREAQDADVKINVFEETLG